MCSLRMSRLDKTGLLVTLFGFISVILVEHIADGQSISGLRAVNEGESLVLQCSLSTCSNSTCTYAWSSPNRSLPTYTTVAHNITLTNILRIWHGIAIACTITVNGTNQQAQVSLDVRYGPSVASISVISPYTVTEGNTTSIACTVPACNPICIAKWFNGSTQMPSTTLFGTPVSRYFAGTYTCNVSNEVGFRISQLNLIVNHGPSVASISVISPYTVTEGNTIPIACTVPACNPICIAKWFNGSTQMPSTTLFGTPVSRYFAGTYTCNVSNEVGFRISQLNLIVNYGPSVASISVSSPYTVTEGNTISIACTVPACNPICITKWFNGSTQMPSTTLFGTPVSRYFAGTYTCNVSNEVGFRISQLNLIVNSQNIRLVNGLRSSQGRLEVFYNNTWGTVCDDLFDHLEAQVVCRMLGFTGNLLKYAAREKAAFGEGTGSIWMDELKCTGNESSLFNCRANDWGKHDCGHKEDAGVDCDFNGQWEASISVSSPYTATEGNNISIACPVPACHPTCIARWFNGSTQLLSTTLFGSPVSRYFAGNYICNVSNAVGFQTTLLQVIVNYGPSTASISVSSHYTVTEGSTIPIECQVPACNPTCIARWFNGSTQPPLTTLFGTPVSRYFAGNYICNVSNAVGFQTKLLQLIVNYAPDVTLTWDERARKFTCTAAGNPTIYTFHALELRISGVPIRNISFQPGSGGSRNAVLQELSYQDTGTYTCAVENGISKNGTIKQSNTLDVSIKDAPIMLGHTRTYNVSKGDKITVTISVYAFPAVPKTGVGIIIGNRSISASDNITVSLEYRTGLVSFHNKSITSGIQTLSVVIDATQEQYFGNCSVNFTNDVGKTTAHFEIFPQGAPDIPLRFEQQSTTYDSVTFTVESGFFNGGDQTLVLQYRRVKGDSVWTNGSVADVGIVKNVEVAMTVDSLSQVTDYEFRVYAFNVYNKSDYSAVLEVATSLHVGMVVASVIGSIAGIVLIVLIVYFARKKMQDEKPPPIVPFANILATLEGEEKQVHAQNNILPTTSRSKTTSSYGQSSQASENIYMNTSTTKNTTSAAGSAKSAPIEKPKGDESEHEYMALQWIKK